MGQMGAVGTSQGIANPMLFLLSFRQRDELSNLYARAGWQVIAARRRDGAAQRFRTSGAHVAVVDARGALEDGLSALADLATPVADAPGALLALLSKGDAARLDDVLAAGATHFLVSPVTEIELAQAVRFAFRHVERLGGGWRDLDGGGGALAWSYDRGGDRHRLSPALASMLHLDLAPTTRALLAALPRSARASVRDARRSLDRGRPAVAFAQTVPGRGRMVVHLQRDLQGGGMRALVEPLVADGGAPAPAGPEVCDLAGATAWIDGRIGAGHPVSLSLVALGGVEAINRDLGREAGDWLLRAALRRIETAVGEPLGRRAVIARAEGAEFLIGAFGAGEAQLQRADTAVRHALARPFVAGEQVARLSTRIGHVTSVPGETAAQLLQRARFAVDAAEGDRRRREELDGLALDIPQAIERDEVEILFQPQVAIGGGRIVGVEALARWRHPTRGEIGAEALFGAAERAGRIVALSEHVQRCALRRAASWPDSLARLRLSINVTAEDVAHPGFADRLLERVDASGFPRRRLTVEITESGLIEDLGEASGLLAELRTGGCRVAIDDFGTGYSSLAYLKALPLDYLKIDKSLTQDITGSPRDRVVVRGVIDMARSLGLAVVAEGVETEEQLDLLAKEGCQFFQGYLCAEPLALPALEALVGASSVATSPPAAPDTAPRLPTGAGSAPSDRGPHGSR
ncbi:putative bifunctional diguanylate cyclase/phosphodiesterase [Sphingomonas desiccabilis]|uniref:EAL domain-containing protein n=1 Tax=Sphingomonas desiccabilis TaxID=429134 RepID=A0A4Q2IVL9_9SPHN|nr:GGDEF domain-containing phosphodiesterase [Sphingomonas desiccabilis]MBB3909936.1 EAL domain-containing protein (putative c-di-GMP-specific phosphodiesterase class I)/GGDEF domain-containing protein/DNA-binding response OmpR family regulator [Sphingomonas desiccabilis]RXZ34605.1 EAL domain-containing protein [Sphingomonas desiccabilis]